MLILLILILLVVICECAAQTCAGYLMQTQNIKYLLFGGLFYIFVVYFLSQAQKTAPIGVINAIWSGLSIVSVALVGYYIFNQKISTKQAGYMGLIGIGICCLSLDIQN